VTRLRFSGHRHTVAAMGAGLVIGCYDGALGPGTGSFFVFTLVGLLGYGFLEATGTVDYLVGGRWRLPGERPRPPA